MKFTMEGYVKIKTTLMKIENKDAIEFKIIDTGIGIKKEEQKNIFKLFTTLSD